MEGATDGRNEAAWSEILVQTEGLKQANRCSPMEINESGEGGNIRGLGGKWLRS